MAQGGKKNCGFYAPPSQYGIAPTGNVIFLPLFLVFAVMTALAVGLWLSALNVKCRDVRYTIPFLTQFWMFASPVAYRQMWSIVHRQGHDRGYIAEIRCP